MRMRNLCVQLLLCACAASYGTAKATTLYATGFENPTFNTGAVAGQDGWSFFSSSGTLSPNVASVENSFAASGSQAVEIASDGANQQAGPYKQVPTSALNVIQSASIYISSGTVQSEWQFAALDASYNFAGGIRINPNGTIDEISAGFSQIGTFNYDSWNTVSLILDYATQMYSIDLNGSALATNIAMCGDNSVCAGGALTGYSYGYFLFCNSSACASGDRTANDAAYLDNYSVSSTPLPAALPLFATGLGGFGLLGWRRKKKAKALAA